MTPGAMSTEASSQLVQGAYNCSEGDASCLAGRVEKGEALLPRGILHEGIESFLAISRVIECRA